MRFPRASIHLVLLLMAGLVAVLGLSRTSDQISSKLGKGPVQINFWNGFTGPDGRTMLEIIRRFNQEHPDIRVSMQRMDWATYYNKLIVSEMDGRGPEMFIIHASTLPRMVRTGFVDDVSDAFSGSSAIPENDFDPYVLKQLDFDGKRVGVALDIHPQGLYCNKQMLKEVGAVDQNGNPKAPETGDEFVNVLTQMIKRSGGSVDQWGFALTLWRNNFQSLIPQFGGRFLDENGNADLNNPGNVRALEFLGSLTKNKLVPPPENGLGWVGYRQKKVGMVWDGAYMLGDLKRLQDLEYLAAPIPQIGPQPGTLADSHVMCIKKGLSEKERSSALTFMKYLSEHSLEWADAGQVPARRSIRGRPEFQKMQVQSAFAKQVPHMMYPPRTPILFELTLEIDLAAEKVMRGRASAKDALDVANQNVQKAITRDREEMKRREVLR